VYCHLCIYVSIQLPCRRCMRAIRGVPENYNRDNSGIQSTAVLNRVKWCTLEAAIEQVWTCTLRA
jgi:hypothetical protein